MRRGSEADPAVFLATGTGTAPLHWVWEACGGGSLRSVSGLDTGPPAQTDICRNILRFRATP